jgi:uncharacterized membrane-anchored protein
MNKGLVFALAAVAALQLATPAYMLAGRERTLRTGEAFRFQTAPVDPYDAFRGRYVALSVGTTNVPWTGEAFTRRRGRTVYVTLAQGANGYAVLQEAGPRRPAQGAYVRARAWNYAAAGQVNVRLPIDRFYLPEDEAPEAERAYREHSRRGNQAAEVVVRVRQGDLVIEDLLVEGKPIRAWLAAQTEPEGSAP